MNNKKNNDSFRIKDKNKKNTGVVSPYNRLILNFDEYF